MSTNPVVPLPVRENRLLELRRPRMSTAGDRGLAIIGAAAVFVLFRHLVPGVVCGPGALPDPRPALALVLASGCRRGAARPLALPGDVIIGGGVIGVVAMPLLIAPRQPATSRP